MSKSPKHIVIDGRIRRASTGRPVDKLLKYLPKLDKINDYTVLVEPNDPLVFNESNFKTVPCPYKQFSLNPIQQITFAWSLYRLKPDFVHFTLTGQAPLLYFGKNVTLTHDLTMLRYARAGRLPEWVHQFRMVGYRLLFWKGNKFANQIIVPTKFVAKDLENYMTSTKNKITVTYEASEPAMTVKSEKPKDKRITKPFIFHLSSPFPHKNVQNLIKAFEILKAKHPDLILVLSGKKEFYFEELEKWITAREYADSIIITGFVSDGELKWLYENAECYVLPSLSEGFGLQGLEAMTYECPVVSSNATCLPEVNGDAVLYFDPLDVDDMSKAIDEVIGSKKLKETLIKKGKTQIEKYSWEKMSRETLEIYKRI